MFLLNTTLSPPPKLLSLCPHIALFSFKTVRDQDTYNTHIHRGRERMKDKESRKNNGGRCVKEWFIASRPIISMLLVQVFAAGVQILSRLILVEGTFVFSLLVYRHVVATLCVAPFAFYFERYMFFPISLFIYLFLLPKCAINKISFITFVSAAQNFFLFFFFFCF